MKTYKILSFLFFLLMVIGCSNNSVDIDSKEDPKEDDKEVVEIDPLATIIPPNYETFKPPVAGEWFTDPVFGTQIKRLTDEQNILGWNGERAMFSADDKYFVIAVNSPFKLRLFDGKTGDFIRDLPVSSKDNSEFRWSYDPEMLVYPKKNKLMGYNIVTDEEYILVEFSEDLGNNKGRLCGGDGNDFDDNGELLLLNFGKRMFAYNLRTGERGPEKDMTDYGKIDYCTVSPSGKYIVGTGDNGILLWNLDWTNERQLLPNNSHMDFGYLNGTEECLVSRIPGSGDGPLWWTEHGVDGNSFLTVRLSDGEISELLRSDRWFSPMYSAVRGSNKKYVCLAIPSHELNPAAEWYRYFGELVLVPLVGEQSEPIRLAHHRCRTPEGGSSFSNQPEAWINHAGDRLFFRSNMGNFSEEAKHDLYMIDLDI